MNANQKRKGLYDDGFVQVGIQPHMLTLPDEIRNTWRCGHCLCQATKTTGIKDGPLGDNSLCHICGKFD